MHKKLLGAAASVLMGSLLVAGCGSSAPASSSKPPSSSTTGSTGSTGSSAASNPLKGKTISLIVPGSPGASHDLFARAIAPELASQLQATVHVVDMPGGGGLKGWNYTAAAKPDGLTISIGNIEGMVANVWETVPGQNFNVANLTFLGGEAGNTGDFMYVLMTNQFKAPFDTVDHLVKTKQQLTELGAIGDVTSPLFFKMYGANERDLTSFSGSGPEKQALLAGDGQLITKTYSAFVTLAQAKKVHVLIAYTMRPSWSVLPNVPTLGAFVKTHPAVSQTAATAEETDVTALDAGTPIFGPPGIPADIVQAEQAAVKAAFASSGYKDLATKAHVGLVYEAPADEESAVQQALNPATVKLMKSITPQSQGEAS